MRLLKALFALLFIALGVLFGALNRDPVRIDLGLAHIESLSLGTSLLLAVLLGAVLAGLVITATVVWPLRHRLRRGAPAPTAAAPAQDDHD
ncbi:lipopolysaccharide assembly protein LapA domain-containing protein [Arenimonas sp.]|uniref:lipopolysaccharide assembly protein LapA domain-containing protein n=1 Tax=Arenimonas sp. TaxID=1872635 RepID=UPI0025D62DB8|nr:lipopolysaccharide assembly protein LapA domain-containing protein [Arenimonas sp.]